MGTEGGMGLASGARLAGAPWLEAKVDAKYVVTSGKLIIVSCKVLQRRDGLAGGTEATVGKPAREKAVWGTAPSIPRQVSKLQACAKSLLRAWVYMADQAVEDRCSPRGQV